MHGSIRQWRRLCWLLVCGLLLAACMRDAPEQRLRATLQDMHAAIEARDIGDAMAPVATDFVGANGLDAAGLKRLMQLQMLGHRQIGVTVGPLDVELRGTTATVRFTALLTGGSGGWVPEQAQTYQVTTGWRLQDGDWMLYHAQWEPAGQ